MVADFKSHILRREEKGAFGIPFRRLLFAGMAGGISYSLLQSFGLLPALSAGLVIGIMFLVFSAPQGGIPRWQRLLYGIEGRVMLAALHTPDGLVAHAVDSLNLSGKSLVLNADSLFSTVDGEDHADALSDWVVYTRAGDTEGLAVQDHALSKENP